MKHSLPPEKFAELCDLIQSLHDEQITSDELARLEEWVCRDEEAGRIYVQYMNLYARLHWGQTQGALASPSLPNGKAQASKTPVLGFLGDVFQAGANFLSRSIVLTLLLSIGLPAIVLTVLLVDLARQPVPMPPQEVARIMGVHKAVWGDADGDLATGVILASGRKVVLKQGLAKIEYLDGTNIILQGPATFQVGSTTNGFLKQGTLTATVPPAAHGFTINTPTAKIIDLGTDFGVAVDKNGTVEAHVFKGQVEVETKQTPMDALPSKMTLTKGQAAKVSRSQAGQAPCILAMASAPNRFVRRLPVPELAKPSPKFCIAHRGDADPLNEGWKISLRGNNAKVKSNTPDVVPVNDGSITAWMIDNHLSQKSISYLYETKSGLNREVADQGRRRGWVLRARIKVEKSVNKKPTEIFLRYADGKKTWPFFVKVLPNGEQFMGLFGENFSGTKYSAVIPNSRDRFVDIELRYNRATDDADVFVDGKCVTKGYAIKATKPETGLRFGIQKGEGTAKFALVEWEMLDEPSPSEQRGGN